MNITRRDRARAMSWAMDAEMSMRDIEEVANGGGDVEGMKRIEVAIFRQWCGEQVAERDSELCADYESRMEYA